MMGRISLYEQSKLPSAVSGYRTSAAPEVSALESASQSVGQLGQSYLAMKERTKKDVSGIEAQNAFNNFRADYARTYAEMDNQSKNAPSKGIDMLKGKLTRAKESFSQKYGAGLSDEARQTYDQMIAKFNETDGARVETWAVGAKYESTRREAASGIAAVSDVAGKAQDIVSFDKEMLKFDEAAQKYASVYGEESRKTADNLKKKAIVEFASNAVDRDPDMFSADLATNPLYDKYLSSGEKAKFQKAAEEASILMSQYREFDNDKAAISTSRQIGSAMQTGEWTVGTAMAEYSFMQDGTKTKEILGNLLESKKLKKPLLPEPVRAEVLDGLMARAKALKSTKGKKMTKAEQTKEYLMLVGEASKHVRDGSLDSRQYSIFAKLADKEGVTVTSFDGKGANYAALAATEDDPREYLLFRGLDDLAKNKKYKAMSKRERAEVNERYAETLFNAIDAMAGTKDVEYAKIKEDMFKTQENTDNYYRRIVYGIPNTQSKAGGYTGYNILARAIDGKDYRGYVRGADGEEHPVVAVSYTGTKYLAFKKKYEDELNKR